MKISKETLKKIINEEINNISEADLTRDQLQPEVEKILSKLSPEEQAIIRQFMILKK
tara:strand:- start:417 stop:587 length:171 start_codon:yes stop_codon:yes gene_type:complete